MRKMFFLFLFVSTTVWVTAQNEFEKVFQDDGKSLRKDLRIEVKDSRNNHTFLPISIMKGKMKGPVFTIVAGVHGYEYPPIIATQQLMREIDANRLNGTLIFIPLANTSSFYTRTPFINPQDQINLNNAFPGKSDGTVTQKLAHFITTNIIPVSDVFLDIHGGDASEDLIPFICYYNNETYPEKTRRAKVLSELSGFEYVVSYAYTLEAHDPAKYAFKQACKDGKVALSIESGKLGNVQKEAVALIKRGVYNMLREMKMYDTPVPADIPDEIIQLNNQKYIDASKSGLFYSEYKAGDRVKKGDVVGKITDEFGNSISELVAPVSGLILYKIGTPPVNVDDTIMCISFQD